MMMPSKKIKVMIVSDFTKATIPVQVRIYEMFENTDQITPKQEDIPYLKMPEYPPPPKENEWEKRLRKQAWKMTQQNTEEIAMPIYTISLYKYTPHQDEKKIFALFDPEKVDEGFPRNPVHSYLEGKKITYVKRKKRQQT
jgi:hypothetical protein